jgi:hypothetical protein
VKTTFERFKAIGWGAALLMVLVLAMPQLGHATTPTVLTVPFDTANDPHTTYANAGVEVYITLGATAPNLVGSGDTYSVTWAFGDGTPNTTFTMTNPYDISTTHQYPNAASVGKTWMATVTVTDETVSASGFANYPVIQGADNQQSQVNVAIDNGLWALHTGMWRCTNGTAVIGTSTYPGSAYCFTKGIYGATGTYGGWEYANYNTPAEGYGDPGDAPYVGYEYYGSIDASNVQAFEVKGHLASGPATDPYTDDVARGLARMLMFLAPAAVSTYSYNYNIPGTSCPNGATTACTGTFDGNSNGQALYFSDDNGGYTGYQGGQAIDALVASGTPAAVAGTGEYNSASPCSSSGSSTTTLKGVCGQTYKNIVQDLADGYDYCQDESSAGGAWAYNCLQSGAPDAGYVGTYNDNSVSQWAAIGLIAADREFGITIPQIVLDANNVWVTSDEDPTGAGYNGGVPPCDGQGVDNCTGTFGYNGRDSWAWGVYADTPSGLVQMDLLDSNGGSFGRSDTRWQQAESYYRDNFCNSVSSGAYDAPRAYTYGLFSFTKSMLEYAPGGTLAPIQYLQDDPAGTNQIDWYAAQASAGAACDGVAQTLISDQVQYNPGSPTSPYGYWYGYNYTSAQYNYETAFDVIMLNKSVFVACVSNLGGQGTASGLKPARIDLTWTGIPSAADGYELLVSTSSNGPFTEVGTTAGTAFSDTSGLSNGKTYYFQLDPLNANGAGICTSNTATIAVPAAAR